MSFEIEYKLGGTDPHLYRIPLRFETCEEALEALGKFISHLMDHNKGPGMELKIIWSAEDVYL